MALISPTREYKQIAPDRYEVTVTPPVWSGFSPSTLELSADDTSLLRNWELGKVSGTIQDLFPHLSPEAREILLSGIGPAEWDESFADDEKGEWCDG